MAFDASALFGAMSTAGKNLASGVWGNMETFAIPELKKIATQIESIVEHQQDYTPDGAKALLNMQMHASVAIICAMTTLTLLEVQKALNAILDAVKTQVNAALPFALL